MSKTCGICQGGHGYTQCPRPLVVPASPRRDGEGDDAYHRRLRHNEYMRLWTQRKHQGDPAYRERVNTQQREAAQRDDDSPGRVRLRRFRDRRTADLATLRDKPCMDCGGKFPVVCMQFDHRPGEMKVMGVAQLKLCSHEKLLAEIAKCDVVCANCRAIRTEARARENLKPRTAKYVQPARAKQHEREQPAATTLRDAQTDGFV